MGLELCRYKELPKTSSGIYAPFNFDAIGLEAGVSFQIANLHYSYGLGFTISGSEGRTLWHYVWGGWIWLNLL